MDGRSDSDIIRFLAARHIILCRSDLQSRKSKICRYFRPESSQRWYINTIINFVDFIHRPSLCFRRRSGDWMQIESSLWNAVSNGKLRWWILSRKLIILCRYFQTDWLSDCVAGWLYVWVMILDSWHSITSCSFIYLMKLSTAHKM
jgi:hypothetical protein